MKKVGVNLALSNFRELNQHGMTIISLGELKNDFMVSELVLAQSEFEAKNHVLANQGYIVVEKHFVDLLGSGKDFPFVYDTKVAGEITGIIKPMFCVWETYTGEDDYLDVKQDGDSEYDVRRTIIRTTCVDGAIHAVYDEFSFYVGQDNHTNYWNFCPYCGKELRKVTIIDL